MSMQVSYVSSCSSEFTILWSTDILLVVGEQGSTEHSGEAAI
jgi:hypothetical protein